MRKKLFLFLIAFLLLTSLTFLYFLKTNHQGISPSFLDKNDQKLSSTYVAHLLWNQILSIDPSVDQNVVMQTLQDLAKNKVQPLNERDCIIALMDLQSKKFEREAQENLIQAEVFLSQLSKEPHVIEKVPNKLFFKLLKNGTGPSILEHSTPLLHLKQYDKENKILLNTYEKDTPLRISLNETLIGFSKDVEGMKIGEKRLIYIHPDLAFRKFGINGQINQVIIFEVEVLDK